MGNDDFICSKCEDEIKNDDEYCRNCGTVLVEDKKCYMHKEADAEGVCLICLKHSCNKCGLYVNNIFLCNEHSEYEIIEGMARVYGSSDSLELEYYNDILKNEGLHPFLFSRKSSSIPLDNFDHLLFKGSTDYYGHSKNEIKLMLPLKEVIEAEKILEPLMDDPNLNT